MVTKENSDIYYEILDFQNPLRIEGLMISLRTVNGKKEDTYLHWHSGIELLYVIDGSVNYVIDGISITVEVGQFVIVNSGLIHRAQNTYEDKSNTTLTIVLPDKWIYEIASISDFYFTIYDDKTQKSISEVLKKIVDILVCEDKYKHILLRRELIELIYVLFSEAYNPHSRPHMTIDIDKIKEVIDYVNKHYSEDNCTLDFISGKFGIQKNYFCRLFRLSTGTTYYKYLSRIRLDAALNLLAEGRLTSAECALRAGFSSEKVFIDWCHRIYACSPVWKVKRLPSG